MSNNHILKYNMRCITLYSPGKKPPRLSIGKNQCLQTLLFTSLQKCYLWYNSCSHIDYTGRLHRSHLKDNHGKKKVIRIPTLISFHFSISTLQKNVLWTWKIVAANVLSMIHRGVYHEMGYDTQNPVLLPMRKKHIMKHLF